MHYNDDALKTQRRYSTIKSIITDLSEIMLPPERITVSEAAEKYRRVYNPPAYTGPWDNNAAPYDREVMDTLESREYSAVCFVAPAQSLKALAIDTPIPTPSGWTTMGELNPGDQVFDEAGRSCTVVAATEVMLGKQCFRITFDDDTTIVTDADHRWYVETKDLGSKVTTTLAMSKDFNVKTNRANGRSRYAVPNTKPLNTPEIELPVDPYVLGLWLGDGSSYRAHITSGREDHDFCVEQIRKAGYRTESKWCRTAWQIYVEPLIPKDLMTKCKRGHQLEVTGKTKNGYCAECARQHSKASQYGFVMDPVIAKPTMYEELVKLDLLGNKHIPGIYLRASFNQRLALLQGLMDSDGTASKKVSYCSFTTVLPELLKGVRELLWSLGVKHSHRTHQPHNGRLAHTLAFTVYGESLPVFRMPRKLECITGKTNTRAGQTTRRWIRNIQAVESVAVRCIAVDSPNHLYLAGEQMVPTHNTEVINNWLAYNVTCDPSDFMVVEKSMVEAKNFSMLKIDRMLRHSPAVGDRLIQRRSASNIFDKRFKSGTNLLIAWPTVNALSGKTIRRIALTDYDRMPEDIGGEGSAFDLGRRRTNTYKRLGMTYVESSPSFDVEDSRWSPRTPHEAPPCKGILGIYNRGDRRRWYWPCPHCGEWFEPDFDLLRWPDSADVMECAEGVYMACPHCFLQTGAMITPHEKYDLNLQGVWLRDGEKIDRHGHRTGVARRSDIASFWLKGPAAALAVWKTLVLNYSLALQEYESTANDRPLKTTVNTDQGKPYIPPSLQGARTPEDIMARAEPLGDKLVPEGVRFLVATIDVQKHRFAVQVHGVRPAQNTVDLVVIDRFDIVKSERLDQDGERYYVNPASYAEDWDLITPQVIEKSYELADNSGRRMSIRMVSCDSGGRAGVTPRAYEYYRRLKTLGYGGRFILTKGDPRKNVPRVVKSYPDSERKDRNAGARGEIPVLFLNSNVLKDWVDAALGRTEAGAGYIHFPDWLPFDYFKELCAETKNAKGEWENPKKLRNEPWDLLYYCYALCVFLRAEKFDWSNAPAWAKDWDENILVFGESSEGVKPKTEEDPLEKLKRLAQQVG